MDEVSGTYKNIACSLLAKIVIPSRKNLLNNQLTLQVNMAELLKGKVAAITGGVSGIGRAIALEFLRQGASVAVNHLGDEWSNEHFKGMAEEAPKGSKLIDVPGDISKKETGVSLVERTVEAFGKLDVFVSNAGVCKFSDFLRYVWLFE